MFPSFLHYLSLPPGSSEASRLGRKASSRGVFHGVKHHQDFALLFGKSRARCAVNTCLRLKLSLRGATHFSFRLMLSPAGARAMTVPEG